MSDFPTCPKCGDDIESKWGRCLSCKPLSKESDKGSHYRKEFKGIKLDVYRILKVWGITCPVQQHIVKKALRGTEKGHSKSEWIAELRCCIDRLEEMNQEEK